MRWPRTPTTPGAVARLANIGTPVEAVIDAWTNPGSNPGWNDMTRRCVQDAMPVLAAALDRLVADEYLRSLDADQ